MVFLIGISLLFLDMVSDKGFVSRKSVPVIEEGTKSFLKIGAGTIGSAGSLRKGAL